ncbi:MAG TPA: hypothetical protein PLD55_15600, partial [bacterium]|nr:hypothetical protein [bacterium]
MNRLLKFFKNFPAIGFLIFSLILFFIVPFYVSGSDEESLLDDVTAMITNAKKLSHKIFVIDTSDSMNSFAYSDYINTCDDTKRNIDHAIALCENSYDQCQRVADAASCADLDCSEISARCINLASTKADIHVFCAKVAALYTQPGLTETAGYNDVKATRYVGPWDPTRGDYNLDLCFYNWTEDTEGNVPNGTNSGHYSYDDLSSGYEKTDRRDWDCLPDDPVNSYERSGLYLNWKYATSLDAVKIILGNVHDFSYKPKQRGEKKCFKTSYYPAKAVSGIYDPISGPSANLMCYENYDYSTAFAAMGPDEKKELKTFLKNNWTSVKEEVVDAIEKNECDMKTFAIINPSPSSKTSDSNCVSCADKDGSVKPDGCEYDIIGGPINTGTTGSSTESISVKYECCKTYECSKPKCRDNDEYCEGDGNPCYLGYYSEYDQDPNHCCKETVCMEGGTEGDDGGKKICLEGVAVFKPGPGNSDKKEFFIDNVVPALSGDDKLSGVLLTKVELKLDIEGPVEKIEVSLGYGCAGSGNADYSIDPSDYTTEFTADGTYSILISDVALSNCSKIGYG